MPVYAGCVYADFCPVKRTRFHGDRYHYFFVGKKLRTKATYKFHISDVFCPDITSFFLSRKCSRYAVKIFFLRNYIKQIYR